MGPARLSALDAAFLSLESPDAPMHVGWAAVFAPPDAGARPGYEDVLAHIQSRLGRAPRYRQKLAAVPLGLGDPVWVDDPRFDIANHVVRAAHGDFSALVDEVLSAPLEGDRPLWELWIAERLDDGMIGVVGKAHHCLVDGLAAVELMALLLVPTGIAVLTFTTTANAVIQLGSAPHVRGRVMALYILVFLGGTPLGAPLIGTLAEAFGPRSSIVLGGVVTALSGIVAALVMTRLRSLRREPHLVRRRPHVHVHRLGLEGE
ncbi:MAG: MFS transporter [Actinobacteria bacterium]|nr:MFS transporter [Actinomycetota bacterium]